MRYGSGLKYGLSVYFGLLCILDDTTESGMTFFMTQKGIFDNEQCIPSRYATMCQQYTWLLYVITQRTRVKAMLLESTMLRRTLVMTVYDFCGISSLKDVVSLSDRLYEQHAKSPVMRRWLCACKQ